MAAATGSDKPYYVFIPGLCHTPAHFQPLVNALGSRGYESRALPLRIDGTHAATAKPADDVKGVRQDIEELAEKTGKDIVIVCHSYGGMVGCQSVRGLTKIERAAEGKAGGVFRIVFIAAIFAKENRTYFDTMFRLPENEQPPPVVEPDPSDNTLARPNSLASEYFYAGLDTTQRRYWASKLQPYSMKASMGPAKMTCWGVDIPKLYIITSRDIAIPPDTQRAIVDAFTDETWTTRNIDSGHTPFLTHKEQLIDMLIRE